MSTLSIHMALHGVLILIVSLLGGHAFAWAINQQKNEVAWRVVHSGGSMVGTLLIALAPIVPVLKLSPMWQLLTVIAWIVGSWVFIIAMYLAAITGARGLKPGGSSVNRLVYLFYLMAVVTIFPACLLLVVGLFKAL